MSYIRDSSSLRYFYGKSTEYVYPASHDGKDHYVEDYNSGYDNLPTFIDLIGRYIKNATDDEEYAWKMVKILAQRLGVPNSLRDHPLTREEWLQENMPIEDVDEDYDFSKDLGDEK